MIYWWIRTHRDPNWRIGGTASCVADPAVEEAIQAHKAKSGEAPADAWLAYSNIPPTEEDKDLVMTRGRSSSGARDHEE